jgi:hypothetical protein
MMGRIGFDALNLLARALGPADEWPARVARERATELYRSGSLAGREVVLLGRRVARAFGRGLSPHFDQLHPSEYFSSVYPTVPDGRGGWARACVWLAPHPSGRSRWWNDPANRSRAVAFFSRLLGRMPFPSEPELPAVIEPGNWWALAETRSWPEPDLG